MSDDELSWGAWRAVIAIAVLFACLLVYSLFDLLYLLLGTEGQATITETYKLPARRGADVSVIEYSFKESDGFERTGKTSLGRNALGPAAGEQIAIQYLPRWFPAGPDGARPARPTGWMRFGLLGVMTVGLGLFSWRAIAQSGEAKPKKRPRKR